MPFRIENSKELLQNMHRRPDMYWGHTEHPFTALIAFTSGFGGGQRLVPYEFHQFVTEHFNETWHPGGKDWMTVLREHTTSEHEAFELFFTLMEAYERTAESPGTGSELLQNVRKRPGMYWGPNEHPFTSLVALISGCQLGCGLGLVPYEFHRFVAEHFNETCPLGSKGWMTFIREHTTSEREAFELFFTLMEAYDRTVTSPGTGASDHS